MLTNKVNLINLFTFLCVTIYNKDMNAAPTKTTVETTNLIGISTQSVEIPTTQAEIYRRMKVDDQIVIADETKRQVVYNHPIRSFLAAQFATRKVEGVIYLIRTA